MWYANVMDPHYTYKWLNFIRDIVVCMALRLHVVLYPDWVAHFAFQCNLILNGYAFCHYVTISVLSSRIRD